MQSCSELIMLAESRDADTQAMVDYWNVVGAPYRWAEVLYDVSKDGPPGSRPFGLMSAAIYDAVVATAKSKRSCRCMDGAHGQWCRTSYRESWLELLQVNTRLLQLPHLRYLSYVTPDHADRYRAMAEEAIQSRLLGRRQYSKRYRCR